MSCTCSAAESMEPMSMTGSAQRLNCEAEGKHQSSLISEAPRKGKIALNKTVLLVDNNPVQLSARQMVLSQTGLEVQIATSADSALAIVRSLSVTQNFGIKVTYHVMTK